MEIQDLVLASHAGNGILFCGAGYSADCISLPDGMEIGAGAALLSALNDELMQRGYGPYKSLKNAADKFEKELGRTQLIGFLKDRYRVSSVTDDMVDIVRHPWRRIYTTNYDNAIELACVRAGKHYKSLNNLQMPNSVPGSGIEIVHLHGFAETWDVNNFQTSCILGAASYYDAPNSLKRWLTLLQDDYDNSLLFTFIGFSADDFHLEQTFYNASEGSEKAFFINRPTGIVDPDLLMNQEKFGRPLAIGRAGLAAIINENANTDNIKTEPYTPSFLRYLRPTQAEDVPTVASINNLLLFGIIHPNQLARDSRLVKQQYHARRTITKEIYEYLTDSGPIALIYGEICDGKSLVLEDLCLALSASRPIYTLSRAYETMTEEIISILSTHPEAVVVIENCFDLRAGRLDHLLVLFSTASAGRLVLTSRSIALESQITEFDRIASTPTVMRFHLQGLDEEEISSFVDLSDQVGAWSDKPRTSREKAEFIRKDCRRSLPAFLLEMHKSQHVRQRYAEEYGKIVALCSPAELHAMVGALYISNLGHDPAISFLSSIFRTDVGAAISRMAKIANGLRIIHVKDGRAKTVPSIGANRLLKEIIPAHSSRLVVDVVVNMLSELSNTSRRDDFSRYIFRQFMRYSILSGLVTDTKEINRFYDNVSQIERCRSTVLFWLQWHMAMVDQKRFVEAKTYLDRAYTEADVQEKKTGFPFDRFQLDDGRSKFLIKRHVDGLNQGTLIHDLKDSCIITNKLLKRPDLTRHPFDTVILIVDLFRDTHKEMSAPIAAGLKAAILNLAALVRDRLPSIREGYAKVRAESAQQHLVEFEKDFPA